MEIKIIFIGNVKMIFAVELEGCMAGAGIFGNIVGKLSHKKKLCQVILLKINKVLKINFYCTILPLSLAIHYLIKDS